jgi:hypothetical protein
MDSATLVPSESDVLKLDIAEVTSVASPSMVTSAMTASLDAERLKDTGPCDKSTRIWSAVMPKRPNSSTTPSLIAFTTKAISSLLWLSARKLMLFTTRERLTEAGVGGGVGASVGIGVGGDGTPPPHMQQAWSADILSVA